MHTYRLRLWWYLAISVFLVLVFVFPTVFKVGGMLSALFIYLPFSLLWFFIFAIFYRAHIYRETTFGVPSALWATVL